MLIYNKLKQILLAIHLWIILLSMASLIPKNAHAIQAILLPSHPMSLPKQDRALIRDLILINYPPEPWKIETDPLRVGSFYDVVIIGAGMSGLTAGAALFKEGIYNIKIFDQNPQGFEGPWKTYARMKTLRSQKELMGPALDIPHLTFHAWFEAQWGPEEWKQLGKISNDLWMEYLKWYRQAMQLPVENDSKLVSIIPMQDCFELEFQKKEGEALIVKCKKVVLATGRNGFGGVTIPDFVKDLPKSTYAHTIEPIDFSKLKNCRVGILGVGTSAFDAAATALEEGVKSVDILMRRECLPVVNKFASLPYKGMSLGYYHLRDEQRWDLMRVAFEAGIPPPIDALHRIKKFDHLCLRGGTVIDHIHFKNSELKVKTNKGVFSYDFLILSTGFNIDGDQQTELRHMIGQIALWKDRLPPEKIQSYPTFGRFPYLGPSFEFLPKEPNTARYLKNLYCFNFGATLSHGLLSSDIPGISIGATRLAQGIAADFFAQDAELHLEQLKNFQEENFNPIDFFP